MARLLNVDEYSCSAMDDRDQRHSARTATVRGIGTARVRPDGIVVGLGVLHRSEAAAEALSETAGKAQKLESLFRELEIDEEDWVGFHHAPGAGGVG